MILIPADYWIGSHTVTLGIPWITPESICVLEKYIKPHHTVLEIGSGGSSVYFSHRAKRVLSFETLDHWYKEMMPRLINTNVELFCVTELDEIKSIVGKQQFDISLVDICNISRYDLAELSINWVRPGGIIIVDNYSADYCGNMRHLFAGWDAKFFDDSHWAGSGTAIFYK